MNKAELIKKCVDKFLSWKLPKGFCPDAGISFKPTSEYDSPHWPMGTNLFDAEQAEAMFKYIFNQIFCDAVVDGVNDMAVSARNKELRAKNAELERQLAAAIAEIELEQRISVRFKQRAEQAEQRIEEAVKAEREACAKTCEGMGPDDLTGQNCADAIRARSGK